MARAAPFKIDLTLDADDIEKLFEPFDPLSDAPPPSPYPDLPATGEPYDPIDWDFLASARTAYVEDLVDIYFRAHIEGTDKIPLDGPLIVAPNHSGTAFPYDAMVLDALLWRAQGYSKRGKFRSVYSPMLAAVWWMRPFGIDNWWRRGGGIDMTFDNYDRLLARGDKVIYYPEGVPGIGKGFQKRYQLQHYHSSFVVLAARHKAPVYPVSIINAEWVNPTGFTIPWLDRFSARFLGIPFFPIPITLLVLVFPFLFYLSFPCRMVFLIGDPIDVRALLREEGCTDLEQPERAQVLRVAERIRVYAQKNLDAGVAAYGEKPYDWKGLVAAMKTIMGRIFRTTPFGWPFTFLKHARDLERPPARNRLYGWLRDLDILAFFLPFGWLVLALLRNLRKPPYGYRGLSPHQRRKREGSYRWLLKTRPLPPRPWS